jgi:hypothetical protein
MKKSKHGLAFSILILCCGIAFASPVQKAWKYVQTVTISSTGLIKFSVPASTLDAARLNLPDLRITDPEGNEIPYWLDRPGRDSNDLITAKSFQVTLEPKATIIQVETDTTDAIDSVEIQTASTSFIKPVRVEGSADRTNWKRLAEGEPLYRQPDGSSRLEVTFPSSTWAFLRLTIDDSRSQPITVSGIQLHRKRRLPAELEVPVKIIERTENPGQTRLVLDLGAANLYLSAIGIETPEPVFTRHVALAQQQLSQGEIRESEILSGEIHRLSAIDNPEFSVNATIPSRRLLLFIKNQDSPPLAITAIRARRREVFAVFFSKQAGSYSIFTGNRNCAAPNYDLSALGTTLKNAPLVTPQISSIELNPSYQQTEVLPEVQSTGTPLDVSDWKYRKRVQVKTKGVQQIEPDLETLSNSQHSLRDLRLLQKEKQIPYILERTSVTKYVEPEVREAFDEKKSSLARWKLKFPQRALPLIGISCKSQTAVFKRSALAFELVPDERGNEVRSILGNTEWVQTPEQNEPLLFLQITSPSTDTVYLEIDNGENPPIRLEHFQGFYYATYLLAKLVSVEETFLYYGNQKAVTPDYDLSLVAPQLLSAEKSNAVLEEQEVLKEPSLREKYAGTRTSNALYWAALTLAVVILIVIISRLIPKTS